MKKHGELLQTAFAQAKIRFRIHENACDVGDVEVRVVKI